MAVAISNTDSATDLTSASAYTFTSKAIGTASADRVVIVAVAIRAASGRSYSSVTIGGSTATQIANNAGTSTGGANATAIYALNVTSGTTATIVVNVTGGSALRCVISVYAMTGTSGSVTASGTNTASATEPTVASTTLTVPANGGAVGVVYSETGVSPTSTWAGLGPSGGDVNLTPGTNWFSTAHLNSATLQTGLTMSDTPSAADGSGVWLAVAAWATSAQVLSLTTSVGSYAITGVAPRVGRGFKISAAVGSYALTGIAATVKKALHMSTVVGTYALTGVAATVKKALHMTTAVGSYALTGVAATIGKHVKMSAAVGVYAITGIALVVSAAVAPPGKFLIRRARYVLQKLRGSQPTLDD